jgi:regulator of sigma D
MNKKKTPIMPIETKDELDDQDRNLENMSTTEESREELEDEFMQLGIEASKIQVAKEQIQQ